MSWYPKELVTCPKCKQRLSTPIDCHQHTLHCKWTRTDFPNGSCEMRNDQAKSTGYIRGMNPYGGFWVMKLSGERLFGAGADHIVRRGRKWRLQFDKEAGWYFV